MSDSKPEPAEPVEPAEKVVFTKEPQPELSLAQRRQKAGITRNRIVLWIAGIGLASYMIIVGLVGILTKSR